MMTEGDVTAPSAVALRKESVDRNHIRHTTSTRPSMSLSARRAWIEITVVGVLATLVTVVALRKESVDRNREQFKYVVQCRKSLSARRAWIEILT